jgi:hypothetical protein
MNQNLHPALIEAYAIAPSDVVHIHTLEFRHDSMSAPLYLVQGFFNRELTTEDRVVREFRACGFEFTLPATDDGGLQELVLTLDNTNNRVSDFCEAAMAFPTHMQVLYRPYLSSDPTTPLMDPPLRLFLLSASVNEAQVTCRASTADFINLKFPTELYGSDRFPPL